MTARFFAWCAAILVSVASGASASSQQANPSAPAAEQAPPKFSSRTSLVLVPVVVTDQQGNHVSGLMVDQFELKQDGVIQKIASFEEVTGEATAVARVVSRPNAFTNQIVAQHPKKLEILVLDLVNTPQAGRAEAQRGLIEFLSRSADRDTLLALLVLRSSGLQMIHNFTSDPSVLIEAIRKVKPPAGSRDSPTLTTHGGDADAEARQLVAIARGAAAESSTHPTPGGEIAKLRAMEARLDRERQSQESLLTLECLQQIALAFAGVPGRKSLLWASTGFALSLEGVTAERTLRMLQDANIAVYPVDVGGLSLGTLGDVADHGQIPSLANSAVADMIRPGGQADPYRLKHEVMTSLANATGGLAFYNLNNSDELFRRAAQDSAEYYMLTYYAKDAGKYGWRKLSIRVLRDGVKVRSRSGFLFTRPGSESETARQSDDIMALISDLEFTGLPITGEWRQIESAGDERKVHFDLSVPAGVPFVDVENENHVDLDFWVMAVDPSGKAAAKIGQRLDTKLTPDEAQKIRSVGLDYVNELTLPPGRYKVRFVVRDNLRGVLGSIVTPLQVD